MTPELWRRLEELFQAALERPPEDRKGFLDEACRNDADLRQQVELLLAKDVQAKSFLESSPLDDDSMPTAGLIGRQFGPYRVVSLLGAGGMGEVYRAHDSKLDRDVAIKTLPPKFARDPERLARFRREARTLASLNHPNIAAIYGLEKSGDVDCLVLELVEGETPRGPLAVPDALRVAKEVAEALEAAHDKGIVHRDLKPANVKMTPEGRVKVLDFGLAKAIQGSGDHEFPERKAAGDASTLEGQIVGTPGYMSPEQALGKEVDRRTDIWAFGCLLYELLTAKRTFKGETISETIASVLEQEPDWLALPAKVPARVRDLLRRCLVKEPRNRLQAIGDARITIEEVQSGTEAVWDSAEPPARRISRASYGIAAVLFLARIFFAALRFVEFKQPEQPEIRVAVNTPSTADPTSFAISPDGRRLVFRASNEGKSQLWLRSLDSLAAQSIAGTEGANYPFWSSDSASIGFFADAKLKRIDIAGGSPRVLANAGAGRGGAWNQEGTIVVAPSVYGSLFKVSATGGDPAPVTQLETGQTGHKFPHFLPDGRHFIYFAQGGPQQGVYVRSLDGSYSRRLVNADTAAVVSRSGFILFLRQTTLFAQAFDLKREELSGNPFPVAEDVAFDAGTNAAGFSAASGLVAYRTGTARQLTAAGQGVAVCGAYGRQRHPATLKPPTSFKAIAAVGKSFPIPSLSTDVEGTTLGSVLSGIGKSAYRRGARAWITRQRSPSVDLPGTVDSLSLRHYL